MAEKSVEECIVTALDVNDISLLPYIPYILQDFWDIGTPPDEIIAIITKHTNHSGLTVLDLGSGKGAVSIQLAKELQCTCLGIDALEDFVVFSRSKAVEYNVSDLCIFETNDIRSGLPALGTYDVIVLGAIGPVFGNYHDTLTQLKPHLNNNGIIIINDAYVHADYNAHPHPDILRMEDILKQSESAGMQLIDIVADDDTCDDVSGLDEEFKIELKNITKRCMELADTYPEKKQLFLGFIAHQTREYQRLSNEVVPAIFVFTSAN